MSESSQLWEILVPCNYNDGKPVRTRHHREWDKRVRRITGGLTILKPGVGQWEFEGELYSDRVIPVRIMCSQRDIWEIADITIQHYEQKAVMYYLISENSHIKYASSEQQSKFIREN